MDLAGMADYGYRRDAEEADTAGRFLARRVPNDALVRTYYVAAPQNATRVLVEKGMTEGEALRDVNRVLARRFGPGEPPTGLSAKAEVEWRLRAEIEAEAEAERFAADCNARYFGA